MSKNPKKQTNGVVSGTIVPRGRPWPPPVPSTEDKWLDLVRRTLATPSLPAPAPAPAPVSPAAWLRSTPTTTPGRSLSVYRSGSVAPAPRWDATTGQVLIQRSVRAGVGPFAAEYSTTYALTSVEITLPNGATVRATGLPYWEYVDLCHRVMKA